MTAIPTARGDFIDSSELGFTLITECVIGPRLLEKEINWPDHTFAEIPVEERLADAVKQLNTAKEHGIDTISDRVIPGAGRDVRTLKRLAEQVPINIIVPTGWYTWRDLPGQMVLREVFSHLLENNPEPTLGDLFVRDIEDGILDTGVRAGTIKFATDAPGLTDDVRSVIRHSASAHRRTGVPLTTHTGIGIGIRTGLLQQESEIADVVVRVLAAEVAPALDDEVVGGIAAPGQIRVVIEDAVGVDEQGLVERRIAVHGQLLRDALAERRIDDADDVVVGGKPLGIGFIGYDAERPCGIPAAVGERERFCHPHVLVRAIGNRDQSGAHEHISSGTTIPALALGCRGRRVGIRSRCNDRHSRDAARV